MENNAQLMKNSIFDEINGNVKSKLQNQILDRKLWFWPFWKDKFSENIIIKKFIEIFKNYYVKQ